MNTITHHLSDSTLSEYASGSLNEPLEVVVACHLTLCPTCRARAEIAERLGGYFIESAESTKPELTAEQFLEKFADKPSTRLIEKQASNPGAGPGNENIPSPALFELPKGLPRPLARRLPADLNELPWKRMAIGIQQFNLGDGHKRDGAFKLLKLQPGTELIEHTHGDHELTLILQGSYKDALGRFGVGDVADLGPENSHKPVIDSEEDCIALIATNSPAHYKGLMGKLIQPFVGI